MFLESFAKSGLTIRVPMASQPLGLRSLFTGQPNERFAAGQILFFEGDPAKSIFEVVEGTLRTLRILPDGRRVITGFLHAGDILGISFKSHYICSAEAINDVTIRRVSRASFEHEVETSSEIRPAVLQQFSEEMSTAQDQMVLLSTKNAEERLCSFLLKELQRAMRNGSLEPVVQLPMTRLDIADYLGLTIETVSRTMTKLASKGVVSTCGRHAVKIQRKGLLAQLAGDGEEGVDDWQVTEGPGQARRRH